MRSSSARDASEAPPLPARRSTATTRTTAITTATSRINFPTPASVSSLAVGVRETFEKVSWARYERGMELSKAEREEVRALLRRDLEALERSTDADEVRRALVGVEIALYDQACPTGYVAPVVPMLVAMVPGAGAEAKRGIVDLLAAIGTLSTGGMMRDGEPLDPASGWGKEFLGRDATARMVIESLDAQAATLLAWLEDPDARVRERAAFVLAYLPSARPAVLEAFEARLGREREEAVVATLLIAYAIVARAMRAKREATTPVDTATTRAAAAIARGLARNALIEPRRRAELIALLDDPAARVDPTSFARGALALMALRLLAPRAFSDADVRAAFVARAGVGDPVGDGPHDQRPLGAHVSLALAAALPPRQDRDFEALDSDLREVLVALAASKVAWAYQLGPVLAARGWPSERTALGRYTGAIAAEARSWMEAVTPGGGLAGDAVLEWVAGESELPSDLVEKLVALAGSDVVALTRDIHTRRFANGADWEIPGQWLENARRNARAMSMQLEILLRAADPAALDAELARLEGEGPPVRINPSGHNAPFGAWPDLVALARAVRDVRGGRPVVLSPAAFSVIRIMRGSGSGLGGMVPYVREVVASAPLEARGAFAVHAGITVEWGFWLYADLAPTDAVVAAAPHKMLSMNQIDVERIRATTAALRAHGRAADAQSIDDTLASELRRHYENATKHPNPHMYAAYWPDLATRLRAIGLAAEADEVLAKGEEMQARKNAPPAKKVASKKKPAAPAKKMPPKKPKKK